MAVVSLLPSAAAVAGQSGDAAVEGAGPLADIVRASGHNLLTAAVGVVAVLGLLLGKRLGQVGRGGLIALAAAVTLTAIVVTYFGTQDALTLQRTQAEAQAERQIVSLENEHQQQLVRLGNDLERARLDAQVALALDASLDDCLDTINQLEGMTTAIEVHARFDRIGAEAVAVEIGLRLGDIVKTSGCARPETTRA